MQSCKHRAKDATQCDLPMVQHARLLHRRPKKDTDPQGRHDAVLGDGLQEARRSGQTLQSRPAGGEEGADHNHPRRRPGQRAYHQVPVDSFAKPAEAEAEGFSEEHPISRIVRGFSAAAQPVDSLVSEDDALDAGTKQHHTGHVWVVMDEGKLADICVCFSSSSSSSSGRP